VAVSRLELQLLKSGNLLGFSAMQPTSILLTVGLIFLIVWPGVLTLVGWLGGWRRLARRYPATEKPGGRVYRFQTIRLGGANYGNAVTIDVGDRGVFLSVFWPFRFGHPNILIPWSELNVSSPPTGWIKRLGTLGTIGLMVGNPPVANLYLPRRVIEDLERDRGVVSAALHNAGQEIEA
jgi:hypothetical protein